MIAVQIKNRQRSFLQGVVAARLRNIVLYDHFIFMKVPFDPGGAIMPVRMLSACADIGVAACCPPSTLPGRRALVRLPQGVLVQQEADLRNSGLASLDRQIAARYRRLLTQFDSASAKLLNQDQQWFMTGRRDDTCMGPRSAKDLASTLRRRLAFLTRSGCPRPPD
ncbi:hypothetical protein [Novosphingobium sp. PhB57]|uniref:hypothetical protein n=1 Tax=Novosphingobium sp. PhB57 TaxID=2485107 RepID=UPI0010489A2E|nr:hypothetical protein [Novosphingobium sp. PhB57]